MGVSSQVCKLQRVKSMPTTRVCMNTKPSECSHWIGHWLWENIISFGDRLQKIVSVSFDLFWIFNRLGASTPLVEFKIFFYRAKHVILYHRTKLLHTNKLFKILLYISDSMTLKHAQLLIRITTWQLTIE